MRKQNDEHFKARKIYNLQKRPKKSNESSQNQKFGPPQTPSQQFSKPTQNPREPLVSLDKENSIINNEFSDGIGDIPTSYDIMSSFKEEELNDLFRTKNLAIEKTKVKELPISSEEFIPLTQKNYIDYIDSSSFSTERTEFNIPEFVSLMKELNQNANMLYNEMSRLIKIGEKIIKINCPDFRTDSEIIIENKDSSEKIKEISSPNEEGNEILNIENKEEYSIEQYVMFIERKLTKIGECYLQKLKNNLKNNFVSIGKIRSLTFSYGKRPTRLFLSELLDYFVELNLLERERRGSTTYYKDKT